MPTIRRKFDSYKVQCNTLPGTTGSANIICYQGSDVVGVLNFFDSASYTAFESTYHLSMFFPYRAFADVLDIIRNEGPLDLVVITEVNLGHVVTRGLEPVGEGEMSPP